MDTSFRRLLMLQPCMPTLRQKIFKRMIQARQYLPSLECVHSVLTIVVQLLASIATKSSRWLSFQNQSVNQRYSPRSIVSKKRSKDRLQRIIWLYSNRMFFIILNLLSNFIEIGFWAKMQNVVPFNDCRSTVLCLFGNFYHNP